MGERTTVSSKHRQEAMKKEVVRNLYVGKITVDGPRQYFAEYVAARKDASSTDSFNTKYNTVVCKNDVIR